MGVFGGVIYKNWIFEIIDLKHHNFFLDLTRRENFKISIYSTFLKTIYLRNLLLTMNNLKIPNRKKNEDFLINRIAYIFKKITNNKLTRCLITQKFIKMCPVLVVNRSRTQTFDLVL